MRSFLNLLFACGFTLAILTHQIFTPAIANDEIPTITENIDRFTLEIPDWDRISWSSIPAIFKGGSISIPQNLINEIGYDPSRSWSPGAKADAIVKLGDVDSLDLEKFALRQVEDLSGIDLSELNLADLDLMNWQTLDSITNAIPGLSDLPFEEVTVVRDFVSLAGGSGFEGFTIGEIAGIEGLSNLKFGEVLDLSQYNFDSIPGLVLTPIESFKNWGNSFLNGVPGLNLVPFSQFPIGFGFNITQVAIADIVWGKSEHGDSQVGNSYFVSGKTSGNKTIPVKCPANSPCAYTEFTGLLGMSDPFFGKRWASGETQLVEGGNGALKIVNGGKEPTGRLVFGNVFKVAIISTDSSTGIARTGLYLRVCIKHLFVDLGCSPYFIGPIPWIPIHEGQLVIMGGSAPQINPPTNYQREIDAILAQYRPTPRTETSNRVRSPSSTTGSTVGGTVHPVAPGTPVTSGYGWRDKPMGEPGEQQFHRGIDFGAPIGTPVYAIDGGVVLRTGGNNSCPDWGNSASKRACGGQLGNWVDIQMSNGKVVRYGHLQSGSMPLKKGTIVSIGQKIGQVGNSGWSTGPHLDIRVHDDRGNYENPRHYIPGI
ncbi:MAG: M23 family metallopeptidase [Prochloraceae cyanobacterium]|nr:M23 family metallopeptidase [Prochloraceae cyanobacterium]